MLRVRRLHRVTATGNGNVSGSTARYFVYDAATVNGVSMSNAKGRLAEAYTVVVPNWTTKITDLGFSYSVRGETTDTWESTPNSGGYYHLTAAYWANGVLNTLTGIPGVPTLTYGVDGEGRVATVSASSGQNPITSTAYNVASQVTALTYGSLDNDAFTFDPNTGRMARYQFNVGATVKSDTGVLTWNPNGTLQQLAITDQVDTGDSQTCNYTYDDLARIASGNCGASVWNQNFSFDPFGNITKTVPTGSTGTAFQPTSYGATTNQITNTPPYAYDGNGNLSADMAHSYTWDFYGEMITVDSGASNGVCLTYDALGRAVEKGVGAACGNRTEIVYSPLGAKVAIMNGQTFKTGFLPLPGGAQVVYNASGLRSYRHPDWLGSSRLATGPGRSKFYDVAYAPYGEPTHGTGTTDIMFTGQNQDTEVSTVPGGQGGLYDFLFREQTPVQGRWLSPDPAGVAAANPAESAKLEPLCLRDEQSTCAY